LYRYIEALEPPSKGSPRGALRTLHDAPPPADVLSPAFGRRKGGFAAAAAAHGVERATPLELLQQQQSVSKRNLPTNLPPSRTRVGMLPAQQRGGGRR
jgi:hypothetical protein